MTFLTRFLGAALLSGAAGLSLAAGHGHDQGALHIDQAWSRATVAGVPNGVAYMTITNHGDADDRLLTVAAPVAERAELHTHIKDGEVMRMRQVPHIDLPAGETVALQPGGLHVMLMGLKAPLKDGSHFPLTLNFEKAGSLTLDVPIALRKTGSGSDAADQHDHDHGHEHKHDHGHQ